MIFDWPTTENEVERNLKHYYGLEPHQYTIDPETLLVSVVDRVDLSIEQESKFLTVKFDRVRGTFDLGDTGLISLEGCPNYVGRTVSLSGLTNLKSFDFLPKIVGGNVLIRRGEIHNPMEFVKFLQIDVHGTFFIDGGTVEKILNEYQASSRANSEKLKALNRLKQLSRDMEARSKLAAVKVKNQ